MYNNTYKNLQKHYCIYSRIDRQKKDSIDRQKQNEISKTYDMKFTCVGGTVCWKRQNQRHNFKSTAIFFRFGVHTLWKGRSESIGRKMKLLLVTPVFAERMGKGV